jgi:hypothetical protein
VVKNKKGTKKFGTTEKKQYLCTAFNSKAMFKISTDKEVWVSG